MRRAATEQVVSVTDAPASASAEVQSRVRRYFVLMSIRLICFVAAALWLRGWLRWAAFAAAVVLPYIAVVLANARHGRRRGRLDFHAGSAPGRELSGER